MGVQIEVQDHTEVMQIKSRELQLENTEKLNNLTPIVEGIGDVNLSQIESDASDIKNIVIQNLDEQTDLDEIHESIEKINKNISILKGQVTKVSKKIDQIIEILDKGD
ncbi:MAG: hypothetical protein IKT40_02135 [Bacilli bacterium]|nr:hypothetical protein [Bacilli bacterium]